MDANSRNGRPLGRSAVGDRHKDWLKLGPYIGLPQRSLEEIDMTDNVRKSPPQTADDWNLPPALERYLTRIGAELTSFDRFHVREWHTYPNGRQYYRDLCYIRITEDGELKCSELAFAPTETEKAEMPPSVL